MIKATSNGQSDLWGPDFGAEPPEPPPVSLFKEQAEALERRTGGRILGEVLVNAGIEAGTVWASFYARIPALANYRHKLASIAYPVDADPTAPYPLTAYGLDTTPGHEIGSMDEFTRWLSETLSSPEIHKLIGNFLRYSQEKAAS